MITYVSSQKRDKKYKRFNSSSIGVETSLEQEALALQIGMLESGLISLSKVHVTLFKLAADGE